MSAIMHGRDGTCLTRRPRAVPGPHEHDADPHTWLCRYIQRINYGGLLVSEQKQLSSTAASAGASAVAIGSSSGDERPVAGQQRPRWVEQRDHLTQVRGWAWIRTLGNMYGMLAPIDG